MCSVIPARFCLRLHGREKSGAAPATVLSRSIGVDVAEVWYPMNSRLVKADLSSWFNITSGAEALILTIDLTEGCTTLSVSSILK